MHACTRLQSQTLFSTNSCRWQSSRMDSVSEDHKLAGVMAGQVLRHIHAFCTLCLCSLFPNSRVLGCYSASQYCSLHELLEGGACVDLGNVVYSLYCPQAAANHVLISVHLGITGFDQSAKGQLSWHLCSCLQKLLPLGHYGCLAQHTCRYQFSVHSGSKICYTGHEKEQGPQHGIYMAQQLASTNTTVYVLHLPCAVRYVYITGQVHDCIHTRCAVCSKQKKCQQAARVYAPLV